MRFNTVYFLDLLTYMFVAVLLMRFDDVKSRYEAILDIMSCRSPYEIQR